MAEIQSGGTHSPLPPQPQLFQLEPIDVAEPWQHELVECFISFSTLSAGKSQIELHETLQQKASESMHSHGELVNGLVYGILTVPAEGNTVSLDSNTGCVLALWIAQLTADRV
ncbi:hypothetical protein IWW52_004304 [Coemansia sp. RSA 2704]|nr:hypothetical protein IWW52_004304 [Coemansia sp. RSA 2704]